MYEISLNGDTLYHPNSERKNVLGGSLHEELNDSGYMNIIVPSTNPLYESLLERKGNIILRKDENEIWWGDIRDISVDFNKNKTIYVVGEMAQLNDTVQEQRDLSNSTRIQILQSIINAHNSMVEPEKRFEIGIVGADANVRIKCLIDWEYSLDAIRNHLCRDDEFVRVRHEGGKRYVDIMPLDSYGRRSEQYISFGENLLDYAQNTSGEKIATICIPLGVSLEASDNEEMTKYMTCAEVNDGKIYVENADAITHYGRITKVVHFNVLNTPSAIKQAGINYLQSAQYANMTLELSAIDLSMLDTSIDSYKLGDYVRAVCDPMGMDAWLPIRAKDTDILNLSGNVIKIGGQYTKGFTTQAAESFDDIEEIIPNQNRILELAKNNASKMINSNGQNGNVAIITDENGRPFEILITNADTLKNSTKAWRWNLSGFGFGTKEAGADDFTWQAKAAITMDGAIVGDFITSGTIDAALANIVNLNASNITSGIIDAKVIKVVNLDASEIKTGNLSASRIQGGTLTLGGKNDVNGTFNVVDASGKTAVSGDKDGINAIKGKIANFTINTGVNAEGSAMDFLERSVNGTVTLGGETEWTKGRLFLGLKPASGESIFSSFLDFQNGSNQDFIRYTWGIHNSLTSKGIYFYISEQYINKKTGEVEAEYGTLIDPTHITTDGILTVPNANTIHFSQSGKTLADIIGGEEGIEQKINEIINILNTQSTAISTLQTNMSNLGNVVNGHTTTLTDHAEAINRNATNISNAIKLIRMYHPSEG